MTENLEQYLGVEMLLEEVSKIFIDMWVIEEVTGRTERLRPKGKVIEFFETEKEMHLEARRLNDEGDKRHLSLFRGVYGRDTPKPSFERVIAYEDF